MSSNELTDKAFWLNYWESKENLVFEVPSNYPFLSELTSLVHKNKTKTLLEIGGFPGYYSVWAPKLGVRATLLDFVVHPAILNQLEVANHLKAGTTGVVEADLFTTKASPDYDLVMSNGLIEHFQNTEDILARHASFVRPGGILFVSLPNFRGLNGWFQKTFDPSNYEKHNISSMDIARLEAICKKLGLRNVNVRYSGYFMLWLENEAEQPLWVRIFKKLVWFPFKAFFKLFPVNTRAFAPYIVITAEKPE